MSTSHWLDEVCRAERDPDADRKWDLENPPDEVSQDIAPCDGCEGVFEVEELASCPGCERALCFQCERSICLCYVERARRDLMEQAEWTKGYLAAQAALPAEVWGTGTNERVEAAVSSIEALLGPVTGER